MMKGQRADFLIGYIFSHVESEFKTRLLTRIDPPAAIHSSVKIPKIWFGLECSKNPEVTLPTACRVSLISKVVNTFHDLAPKYHILMKMDPDEQYLKFTYIIEKRDEFKEMTIAEIEKALGHRVKIIKE